MRKLLQWMSSLRHKVHCKNMLFGVALIVYGLAAYPTYAAKEITLVLNDTNDPPFTTSAGDGFLDIVIGEAFHRAGLKLKLVKLPPERGLVNANAGIEDGDLTRIAGLEKVYPNLVMVPEKEMDWHFVAFTRRPATAQASWQGLEPLSVGHIKGWKIFEKNLTPATQISTTNNSQQLFNMLDKNRIDVALYERWLGYALIRDMGIRNVHVMEPSLAVREMYLYLNKRHADKVPALAAALQAIKKEGMYTRVCREKLAALSAATTQCESYQ